MSKQTFNVGDIVRTPLNNTGCRVIAGPDQYGDYAIAQTRTGALFLEEGDDLTLIKSAPEPSDFNELTAELLPFTPRRTGVIVAARNDVTADEAEAIVSQLEKLFPGVAFAVVPGVASVAFEYDEADQ